MSHLSKVVFMLVLMSVLPAVPGVADEKKSPKEQKRELIAFLAEIDAIVEKGDHSALIKRIESPGDPTEVTRTYFLITRHLYTRSRDLPKMLAVGQSFMDYARARIQQAKGDEAEVKKWRGLIKSMTYNLSSNAWPGWNEKGIEVTRKQSEQALRLAKENLRLAVALERDPEIVGTARWLVGAQHLALKQPEMAVKEFKLASNLYRDAEKPEYRWMAEGYRGIAQLTQMSTAKQGRMTVDKAIRRLEDRKTGDAKFFTRQLQQVEKVFVTAE